ncbi:MAG: hypothetical protein R2939_22970 [Kofleriaceae bacterium]
MQTNDTTTTTTTTTTPVATGRYGELLALVTSMQGDFEKFFGQGNKAAGTRVRAAMQELKAFAQTVRTEVQTLKNAGSTTPSA